LSSCSISRRALPPAQAAQKWRWEWGWDENGNEDRMGPGAHKSTSDACMQSEDGPSSMHVRVRHRPCMSTIHRHLLRATVYLHAAYHRRHRTSFNVALPKKMPSIKVRCLVPTMAALYRSHHCICLVDARSYYLLWP